MQPDRKCGLGSSLLPNDSRPSTPGVLPKHMTKAPAVIFPRVSFFSFADSPTYGEDQMNTLLPHPLAQSHGRQLTVSTSPSAFPTPVPPHRSWTTISGYCLPPALSHNACNRQGLARRFNVLTLLRNRTPTSFCWVLSLVAGDGKHRVHLRKTCAKQGKNTLTKQAHGSPGKSGPLQCSPCTVIWMVYDRVMCSPHVPSFCAASQSKVPKPCPHNVPKKPWHPVGTQPYLSLPQSLGHFNFSSFQIEMKVAGLNTTAWRLI